MFDEITGVILAGGLSTRMKRDKALLPSDSKPDSPKLIEVVAKNLQSLFHRVVLSVAADQDAKYSSLKIPLIYDEYPAIGPLGGITSVLSSEKRPIFCLACDMPFVEPELVRFICGFPNEAVIPVWNGKMQVMLALYKPEMLPNLRNSVEQGVYKMTDAIAGRDVKYVSEAEIKKIDPEGKSFQNLNTPEDYKRYLSR